MSTWPLAEQIGFKNYRNFTDFQMAGLKQVNLIVGDSNVGKTGLLEGLVALWGTNEQFHALPNTFRMQLDGGQSIVENYWQWFFPEKKPLGSIGFSANYEEAEGTNSRYRYIHIKSTDLNQTNPYRNYSQLLEGVSESHEYFPSRPRLMSLPVGMGNYQYQVDRFNELASKNNGKEQLVKALRIIEPRLEGLEYLKLPSSSQAMVYADIGMEYKIPTTQFGHGFTRSMEMLTQLILSQADIMIADEIENGIHYGSLEPVWKAIITHAMKNGIQVFATTHSRECIAAAHAAMLEQDEYSLNVVRLQSNREGEVVAVNHDQEAIEAALTMGMPLR